MKEYEHLSRKTYVSHLSNLVFHEQSATLLIFEIIQNITQSVMRCLMWFYHG